LRSEFVERSFAHVCETGESRRTWLRGLIDVSKRYTIQVAARNLGVMMRKMFGMGTPRSLQDGLAALSHYIFALVVDCTALMTTRWSDGAMDRIDSDRRCTLAVAA
jgi:hypothetical protein